MNRYIPADKLIVEIERRKELLENGTAHTEVMKRVEGALKGYNSILDIIASLQQEAEEERRKRNDEMQKTSIEYRDSVIKHIEAKRALPSFQGQLLHNFKNELNTMKQILNIQMWPQTQYAIFEKVALAFASWGGYHFHPKKSLPKDELEQGQPDLPGIEESGIPGKDYIPVEWVDACEKYGKWKIVKQEQPEVDLESLWLNLVCLHNFGAKLQKYFDMCKFFRIFVPIF